MVSDWLSDFHHSQNRCESKPNAMVTHTLAVIVWGVDVIATTVIGICHCSHTLHMNNPLGCSGGNWDSTLTDVMIHCTDKPSGLKGSLPVKSLRAQGFG